MPNMLHFLESACWCNLERIDFGWEFAERRSGPCSLLLYWRILEIGSGLPTKLRYDRSIQWTVLNLLCILFVQWSIFQLNHKCLQLYYRAPYRWSSYLLKIQQYPVNTTYNMIIILSKDYSPLQVKHTVGILLYTNMLSRYWEGPGGSRQRIIWSKKFIF